MQNFKNKICSLILALFLIVSLTGCASTDNSSFNLYNIAYEYNDGQKLFLEVWEKTRKEFYKKDLNHQKWEKWRKRYTDKIKTKEDAYVAIDTMLESLDDPYTRFLRPEEYEEQNMSIDSKLFGIGVNITTSKGKTLVISTLKNTPAQEAGLKTGDIILQVDKKPIGGLKLSEVARLVRGEAGTPVVLKIKRNDKILTKKIIRKEIKIETVELEKLDNDISYIKITSFISQDTTQEFIDALQENLDAKGYILDLRGNTGGLLPNAVVIANIFIKKGRIVSIVDRNGKQVDIDVLENAPTLDLPMVVLIDEGSASASEILAGALKDHKRAILIGEKSYGKGLVQKIESFEKETSGMNITIAKYLTPNGININHKGIEPDINVKRTKEDFLADKDPQLDKAKEVIKKEIEKYFVASK